MPRTKRPRRGSKAYWPKKRAKRIHPTVNWDSLNDSDISNEVKPLGFAGYKAGMRSAKIIDNQNGSPTQGMEIEKPVTIIECPPLSVFALRFYKKDPYGDKVAVSDLWSEKIDKDLARKLKLPKNNKNDIPEEFDFVRLLVHTKPRNSGLGKKKPEVFELGLGGDKEGQLEYAQEVLGSTIKVSDLFNDGELVDTISITKGKGYQGPVKRFGIAVQSRNVEQKHRHVGTLGNEAPGRIFPGLVPFPGQLGFQKRTEVNKRVIGVGETPEEVNPSKGFKHYGKVKSDYVILEGSVPGPSKRLIMLRYSARSNGKGGTAQTLRELK